MQITRRSLTLGAPLAVAAHAATRRARAADTSPILIGYPAWKQWNLPDFNDQQVLNRTTPHAGMDSFAISGAGSIRPGNSGGPFTVDNFRVAGHCTARRVHGRWARRVPVLRDHRRPDTEYRVSLVAAVPAPVPAAAGAAAMPGARPAHVSMTAAAAASASAPSVPSAMGSLVTTVQPPLPADDTRHSVSRGPLRVAAQSRRHAPFPCQLSTISSTIAGSVGRLLTCALLGVPVLSTYNAICRYD